MISLYTHLLKDVEGEVRDVTASKLQGILFCKKIEFLVILITS